MPALIWRHSWEPRHVRKGGTDLCLISAPLNQAVWAKRGDATCPSRSGCAWEPARRRPLEPLPISAHTWSWSKSKIPAIWWRMKTVQFQVWCSCCNMNDEQVCLSACCTRSPPSRSPSPQWGAADAEIKVSSGENTELKRSPFKTWSRSAYSPTCYGYCQGFLPCLLLPFRSIHQHFFQILARFFLCWL